MPTTISSSKALRKNAASPSHKRTELIAPNDVIHVLEKHLLVDGFKLVFDPVKSRGSKFVDASTGRELIDLYGFYASQPIGFNHPHFSNPQVEAELLAAAKVKVANSD